MEGMNVRVRILPLTVKYKIMEPTQLQGVKTNRPGASNSNVWSLDKGATVIFCETRGYHGGDHEDKMSCSLVPSPQGLETPYCFSTLKSGAAGPPPPEKLGTSYQTRRRPIP